MRLWGFVSTSLVCLAAAACGGGGGGAGAGGSSSNTTSSTATSSTATSSTATSSNGSGGASALCTDPPPNEAAQISDVDTPASMPPSGTATGGTIISGTYFMTAVTNYESGSTGGTHKDTLVFDTSASTFVVNQLSNGTESIIAGTYTTSGHTIMQDLACPAMVTATVEYTAAGDTLTIYNYDAKSVSVWTKQ